MSRITTFDELEELWLLEDFKSCVPRDVVVHLNEQKVSKLAKVVVFAD